MEHPIKRLRKERKLTQIQLAQEVGVDQATVSKWEAMKMLPTKEYEDKLAELFGVSIDTLIGLETPEEFSYLLYDTARDLPKNYTRLISDYSTQDDFRRMVKIWSSLTELQRMELIGFAQGIMGREPTIDDRDEANPIAGE